ncbi:MAG: ubiquinone biosynthesis regulatory protein kinase UbiB [Granulosicoccaceae bacterium]
MIKRVTRLFTIQRVFVKYALEDLFLINSRWSGLRHLSRVSPTRYLNQDERALPRGQRIRLALEELGPVFVKLGQVLSTRRDLLPDDIGNELALLQDKVPPFAASLARDQIELSLGKPVNEVFKYFEDTPLASASVAQVHGVILHDGTSAIVKVLRPDIQPVIERDLSLMYLLADICKSALRDGKRMRPREVVADYDHTIHKELDLIQEASNAVVLRNNHKDSPLLYVPEIYWDYTRKDILVMERIEGIPIRDVDEMHAINMDMKKLAETGVEIFYTQVFKHNFFHADMHPGNIFVSRNNPSNPQYIAVDFGIVGSLTAEDQRYLGENILAFFQRDYRRVAQLHVDSGWVPAGTRVSEFEAAVRAVCEPIFEKPLAEISFGQVLLQLFHTARRFEMEVQPQLVLLQKTLLNIEGLGRQLYPQLDLWATAKPFLEQWMKERQSPQALAKKLVAQAPQILEALPAMPMLVHQYLKDAPQRAQQTQPDNSSLKQTIAGSVLVMAASIILASAMMSSQSVMWYFASLVVIVVGLVLLRTGLRN